MKNAVYIIFFLPLFLYSCNSVKEEGKYKIGFVEAFEDATIAQAKTGFFDALAEKGFSEERNNLIIIYRNAQSDIPALTQIINYFVSEKVDLIGASSTLASIAAVQRNNEIPVFISVAPMPEIMGLKDKVGKEPKNLFGTGETLDYIDTSFSIIPQILQTKVHGRKIKVGMIYNQSEPQSVDAYNRILGLSKKLNVTLIALPLNTSADAQMVTRALLNKNIDAFFANPDNTVFAAFETIINNCNAQRVPVFTSEAGLVDRGAVAAFGADIYQWGYQSGLQAAEFLLNKESVKNLKVEIVRTRKRIYNSEVAEKYGFNFPENFAPLTKK